ncbi:hypothetical protein [Maribellus maritimus]|uniref:hypothetical protein n=1 Tax=Maribellus maritimus TaxID=2870838 RepID=UPI001EE9E961|nr:hypothetical protein [Maribellus maritimus]MCG6189485.1 hypothetical protein [Maribellus maritimus]
MKISFSTAILFVFVLLSCEKGDDLTNGLSKTPPEIQGAVNYDLNDDSIDDIKVKYQWYTWDGINSSGNGISGSVEPLNASSILLKRSTEPLFCKLNDTIRFSTNEPFYWEKYLEPDIVSITNSFVNDYFWPSEWRVHSDITEPYYFGIKIDNSSQLVGWVQIEIDKSTGGIQVVNKNFSTEEFIVAGK